MLGILGAPRETWSLPLGSLSLIREITSSNTSVLRRRSGHAIRKLQVSVKWLEGSQKTETLWVRGRRGLRGEGGEQVVMEDSITLGLRRKSTS